MTVLMRASLDHATLTERELEVLRLLAAGHTVKSIADKLGRTEASINERLRDARRKTGLGSSRELARLLDEQKIWDKNSDLPDRPLNAETFDQPRTDGRNWSKGRTFMLVAMSLAAAGALLVQGPLEIPAMSQAAQTAAVMESPLVGKWALDVARIPESERPRSVEITFGKLAEEKWTMTVDIVAADGTRQHAQSTASIDGSPVPVTGNMGFIDTSALRQPSPNTLVATLGKNGSPVSTRVYTVSKDRKSMTETIVWAGSSLPKLETTYFHRVN